MSRKIDKQLIKLEATEDASDLLYFARNRLKIELDAKYPRPEEEVGPMYRWIERERPAEIPEGVKWFDAWLSPRETAKSYAYAAWVTREICFDPNIAVVWSHQEKEKAADMTVMIRDWLGSLEVKKIYGDMEGRPWDRDAFTVKRTKRRRDPTVRAMGLESSTQGPHPDISVFDDLQGRSNNTYEGRKKIKEFIESMVPLIQTGGRGRFVGTRWHEQDFAGHALEQWKRDPFSWEMPGHRGYFGATAVPGDEDFWAHAIAGEPLFPSILGTARMAWLKANLTADVYYSQYENDCTPKALTLYHEEDLQRFPLFVTDAQGVSGLNPLLSGAVPFMSMDPASGMDATRKGDKTAIIVAFVKWVGDLVLLYVVDVLGGHLSPKRVIDSLFNLFEKWGPVKVFVETNAYKEWLMNPIRDEASNRGYRLPVTEITHGPKANKHDRMSVLHVPYATHRVWHAEHLKNCELERELLRARPDRVDDPDDHRDALATLWTNATKGHGQGAGGVLEKLGTISGADSYRYRSTRM